MEQDFSKIFEGLNPAQNEAVRNIYGPSLIIAGAGSGKTRVLTCRIANMLACGEDPSSILALTFTNKAAKEMRERITGMVGYKMARKLTMGTFHSVFRQFLCEEAELLGYPKTFTIYDTSDSRGVIKQCLKDLQLDEKVYKPAEVYSRISMAKNNLVTASAYKKNATLIQNDTISKKPLLWQVYEKYEQKCKTAGAMDFDDLLLNTNILFRDFPQALDRIRERFKFILVDEYQDTNYSQYLIIKKLAQSHGNISVVGDDAQSIYSFRGARIENILNFKKDYPQAKEFRLEQNYRSTQTIVNAANTLIGKNKMQLKKKCFSEQEIGEKIELISAFTEQEEGLLVASSIVAKVNETKEPYSSFAVLYRTNAQSRVIEESLRRKNIPYRIYSGKSFYERAEIKLFLSYLKLVANERDDESFLRIINVPARGLGDVSLQKLRNAAADKRVSLSEAVKLPNLEEYGLRSAVVEKFRKFVQTVVSVREAFWSDDAYHMALRVNGQFGIIEAFKQENTIESLSRVENLEELLNSIKQYVEDKEVEYADENPEAMENGEAVPLITLDEYLANVTLLADVDIKDDEGDSNKVSLMTVHSSKGLEFPYVYVIGMEENLFPSRSSDFISEQDLEEERRLFYVAITRAGKAVKLSFAHSRMKWGQHVNNKPSRFIKEIDKRYILNPLDSDNDEQESLFKQFSASRQNSDYQRRGPNLRPVGSLPQQRGAVVRPLASSTAERVTPDFTTDISADLRAGMKIEHERFGFGRIVSLDGIGSSSKAVVEFDDGSRKTLMLKYAKIRVVDR